MALAQTAISFYDATVTQGNGIWGPFQTAVVFESQATGTLGTVAFALSTHSQTQSVTLEIRSLVTHPEISSETLGGEVLGVVNLGQGSFDSTGFVLIPDPSRYTVFDFSSQHIQVTAGSLYAWVLSVVDPGENTYLLAASSASASTSDPNMRVYGYDPDLGWGTYGSNFGVLHSASVIPEPSATTALLGGAALAWVAMGRRRRPHH